MLLLLLSLLLPVIADDEDVDIREAAILPVGFSPRWYMDALPAHRLPRRQGDGQSCGEGNHTCLELGEPGVNKCCPLNTYCFLKDNWEVGCCGFGSTCGSACPASYYLFNNTITSTSLSTASATASGSTGIPSVFASTTTTISIACKTRQCSITAYQCAAQFGGNCCDNSQGCISNGCAVPVTTNSALVPTYNGCGANTNMFQCPAATGTGDCCSIGQTCTTGTGGGLACTGTPSPPGGANVTAADTSSLSQGAKAGIGAGVALGAAIVIAAVTWFCVRRRRESLRNSEAAYRSSLRNQQSPAPNHPGGATGAADMSEVSGPASRSSPHQTGLVYEYFGPDAVRGPYTQDADETHETTAMLEHGVPVRPRGPSDIAAPVEIDSRLRHSDTGNVAAGVAAVGSGQATPGTATNATTPAAREEEQGPFELYGSMTPSPLSPEDGTGTGTSRNMDYLTVHSSEAGNSSPRP